MNPLLAKLSPTITNMIRLDHTHVMATFHQFEADTPAPVKRALVNTVCLALEIHAQLEEEIFYPAMRALPGEAGDVARSIPEHDEMKRLIATLRGMEADRCRLRPHLHAADARRPPSCRRRGDRPAA